MGHLPMEILRMVHKLMVHRGLVEGVVQDGTIRRICIQQGVLEILTYMRMRTVSDVNLLSIIVIVCKTAP